MISTSAHHKFCDIHHITNSSLNIYTMIDKYEKLWESIAMSITIIV